MIVINFSHPLSSEQTEQIEQMVGERVERVIAAPLHFDNGEPFAEQVVQAVDAIGLTSEEWQGAAICIIPPALNFITAALLAELHGRMGYFPPVVRIRPVPDALPPRYAVAEVLNLQAIRDRARARR